MWTNWELDEKPTCVLIVARAGRQHFDTKEQLVKGVLLPHGPHRLQGNADCGMLTHAILWIIHYLRTFAEQLLEVQGAVLSLAACDLVQSGLHTHRFARLAHQLLLQQILARIVGRRRLQFLVERIVDDVQVVLTHRLRFLGNAVQHGVNLEAGPLLVVPRHAFLHVAERAVQEDGLRWGVVINKRYKGCNRNL